MTLQLKNTVLEDVKGPKISVDVDEVAETIGPELDPNADKYRVLGGGHVAHDSAQEAINAAANEGMYICGSETAYDVTFENVEGVEIVNYEEPVSQVEELANLVEEHSSMSVNSYRHSGSRLASGDSPENALKELDGRRLGVAGDVSNEQNSSQATRAGYIRGGEAFGYSSGDLNQEQRATLDASVEQVLGIEDITDL